MSEGISQPTKGLQPTKCCLRL